MMRLFYLLFFLVFNLHHACSWGFLAHRQINRLAVYCLPPELFGFFKYQIDFVATHAVNPDKRRYAVEGEAACHYIDLDRYGPNPLDSIPQRWTDAAGKFTQDTLMAHGIVPWAVQRTYYRLVDAFSHRNPSLILRYAADLGHYVGDAHVPLHTTSNYNGQKTNQHGIHGLWESRIPEISLESYLLMPGRCAYVDDPLKEIWKVVAESHRLLDTVLTFERDLSVQFPEDQKYTYELRGSNAVRVYSAAFALAYEQSMEGMVERRMMESIRVTASLWYSAWLLAGQPNLEPFIGWKPNEVDQNQLKSEEESWLHRIFNVPEHNHE